MQSSDIILARLLVVSVSRTLCHLAGLVVTLSFSSITSSDTQTESVLGAVPLGQLELSSDGGLSLFYLMHVNAWTTGLINSFFWTVLSVVL